MTVDNNKNFPKKMYNAECWFSESCRFVALEERGVGFALPRLSQINSSAQVTGIRINLELPFLYL